MLNIATCYVILLKHPEQQFIAYSALIGFICAVLELMLLINKAIKKKFFGGDNGPPAPPRDPATNAAQAHAQAAATSAAQAQAAEARVVQIAEALANSQGSATRHQTDTSNYGTNLSEVLVVTAAVAASQPHTTTTQDIGSGSLGQKEDKLAGAQDVGSVSQDQKEGTRLSSKDITISELSTKVSTVVKAAEMEKNITQLYKPESSETKSFRSKLLAPVLSSELWKRWHSARFARCDNHQLSCDASVVVS